MNEMPQCIGCGTVIQTEDKNGLGYAPASSLEKEMIICQRCFRLKNYNEIQPVSLTDDDFLRILNGLGQQQGLIVKIVDIFDFNGSWLPGLHRFVGNNPVLLVANKRSEEHTSELQSRENLVCRLLLDKKKSLRNY